MATQNGKSCEHITNFFLNLMCMRFLADPNAQSQISLVQILRQNALSLNAMKSVGQLNTKVIGNVAERKNKLLCS